MSKVVIFTFLICAGLVLRAQDDNRRVIQFTGVVFASDSSSVVPGVHVYVPKGGRGTTSNPYGFFSMPVLEGDSVVFSAIGFKRTYYIIPEHDKEESLKLLITLAEDITFLNEVEVNPYPTEAVFKQAVLAMEMPYQDQYNNMNAWLTAEYMRSAYKDLPGSANTNHAYYMELQRQANQNRYQTPANNLLNPWAWTRFIQSLKKTD